ncbi:hypothetical protein MTsPCn9_01360 [Croceitalea sp. MTPC9]|uniref:hypothetical protein n=1 Tax=unclassified Croceitalea TaxID=2632280 RepID=UPI002B3BA4B5|nr:hypothetical protein MTsPCn6_07350 [Croceitalea sp. MTPC6]GMN15200.1 hypothetical protein MTsPCn9_01360 [Croceitalea sp. MTPC9]
MKTILTLTFVLFFGATALAQNVKTDTKVTTIEMGVVLSTEIKVEDKKEITKENTLARVYKFKNTRVKKALVFETKSEAKIA